MVLYWYQIRIINSFLKKNEYKKVDLKFKNGKKAWMLRDLVQWTTSKGVLFLQFLQIHFCKDYIFDSIKVFEFIESEACQST